jgi:hypothetical protein
MGISHVGDAIWLVRLHFIGIEKVQSSLHLNFFELNCCDLFVKITSVGVMNKDKCC